MVKNKFRIGVNIGEFLRMLTLIDVVVHNKWARDVPIIPGRPTKSP